MWQAVEAMETAKDWEALADWETAYWADGPGQSPDRVPAIRARVHDWLLSNYQAEKVQGQPRPLDPPAEKRLRDLRAPLLVLLGTLDEAATSDAMRHLTESVPGSRLEELESAHMINLEQPERFHWLLREHLAKA
jgi:3-oxoadipate enol-lactonase